MSAPRDILKNYVLTVDGRGFAGNTESFSPPNLSLVIDDHRAGGMDTSVPIDMGQEAMEASFVLTKLDADTLALFGVTSGEAQLTFRGAYQSYDGTVTARVINLRGKIVSKEESSATTGEKQTFTYTMKPTYYRDTIGGRVVTEIDALNMTRVIDGVDQLAAIRQAIGL